MSAPKVDVMAVMYRATGNLLRSRNQAVANSAVEVREARAAVAELIEALRKEDEWRKREADGAIDPEWDYETMVGQYRRAALARIGSAS